MKRSPIERLRAAGKMSTDDDTSVCGYWRDYLIWIDLEPMGDWYIRVTAPDGVYLYDGWWRDSKFRSASDAVEEAFRGAELLEAGC
jgi:hypothetical protein